MINLADLFEHVADTVPDRLALVAGEVRLTYRELDERANRVAHWLIDQGVRPGQHVGVLSWNRAEWLETMIGCFKARVAPVNVNYRYVERELAHLLADADCVALVGEADLLERVRPLTSDLPHLRLFATFTGPHPTDARSTQSTRDTDPQSAGTQSAEDTGAGARGAVDTAADDAAARAPGAGDMGAPGARGAGAEDPGAGPRGAEDPGARGTQAAGSRGAGDAGASPAGGVVEPARGPRWMAYEEALAGASAGRGFGARSPDDPYLLYTGGTTGLPKGVLWRAEDIYLAAMSVYSGPIKDPAELNLGAEGLRFQVHAPLMHGNGQWSSWICMSAGATVILWTGRSFDAVQVLELAERERSQVLSFAGDGMAHPVADELLRKPYKLEVFSVGSGGAPLSKAVREKISRALPDTMIMDSFGGSETGALGAVGEGARFTLGQSFAILGPNHQPLGPGEQGVLARSGNIPLCYYKDPDKTAATFVTGPDGTRWALQGDHAIMGDDGTAALLGRGSMVINTGGEKVFPEEVEIAVRDHPNVHDAMVVGGKDPRFGQRVTAIVALEPGATLTLDALAEHCRGLLAGYKVPRALIEVEEIRRTPVGKLDYSWARSLLE